MLRVQTKAYLDATALLVWMKESAITEHFARCARLHCANEVFALGGPLQCAREPVGCLIQVRHCRKRKITHRVHVRPDCEQRLHVLMPKRPQSKTLGSQGERFEEGHEGPEA